MEVGIEVGSSKLEDRRWEWVSGYELRVSELKLEDGRSETEVRSELRVGGLVGRLWQKFEETRSWYALYLSFTDSK